MDDQVAPSILSYLSEGLELATAELARTWRPEDPAYRAHG